MSWLLGTSFSPSWEAGAALGVLRGTQAWGAPSLWGSWEVEGIALLLGGTCVAQPRC